jgi:hypothetical protein
MSLPVSQDAAFLALSRQLYWAQEVGARHEVGTRQIREDLLEFVAKMRSDERAIIPLGEPHLSAQSLWKRKAKYKLFGASRFASRRYDRLLGDAVDLTVALSERVIRLEQEVEELRERTSDRIGERGGEPRP